MADGYKLSKQAVQRTTKAVREVLGGVGTPSRRPVPTRRRDRSGAGKKYELLRGTVTAVDSVLNVVTLSATPSQLPTGAKTIPTGAVKAYNRHGITINVSDEIYCIHDSECYDDTGTSNTHGVLNWSVLPFEGLDTTKTLNFRLYQNSKAYGDSPVEGKLLTDAMVEFGDPVDLYDPHGEFTSGGSENAYGRCTLVRDIQDSSTRLEITHLEGPALWISATLTEDIGATTADMASADVDTYKGIGWWRENPGETVSIFSVNGLHDTLKSGTKVHAILLDPDESPLEYAVIETAPIRPNVAFAVVITEAPAATGWGGDPADGSFVVNPNATLGTCALLEWVWDAGSSEWKLEEADPGGGETMADIDIPFINGDIRVPIAAGKIIKLQSDYDIEPGMVVDEDNRPPVGTYAFVHDYLEALPGWSGTDPQVLYHDSSGVIRWGVEECTE